MKDFFNSILICAALVIGVIAFIGAALYSPGIDFEARAFLVLIAMSLPAAISFGGYCVTQSATR